jgi:hypothetical protein
LAAKALFSRMLSENRALLAAKGGEIPRFRPGIGLAPVMLEKVPAQMI